MSNSKKDEAKLAAIEKEINKKLSKIKIDTPSKSFKFDIKQLRRIADELQKFEGMNSASSVTSPRG